MSFTFNGLSREFSSYMKRAKPTLPEDMRRLIDDAVADGRVTRVPMGASARPYPVWCPKTKVLVEVDPKTAVQKNQEAKKRALSIGAQLNVQRGVEARTRILEVASKGASIEEIAAETGYATKTVRKHIRASGIAYRDRLTIFKEMVDRQVRETEERRAEAATLASQGLSREEIASRLGVTPRVVYRYLLAAARERDREVAA